jgi:hypothetical protein
MSNAAVCTFKPGKRVPDPAILAMKELARDRGEIYLEYAQRSFNSGDSRNARSYREEGLQLTVGPFYLCVQDQLSDLLAKVNKS